LHISSYVIGKELECDEPSKFRVFGLVDNTHSTATEFLDHAVMRNGLAEQAKNPTTLWAGMLGHPKKRVK